MRQLASSVVASFSGVKHFFLPPFISFSSALCLYPVKLVCLYARVLLCECACVCVCLGLVCFHVYLCVQSTHNHFLAPSHRHCYRGCCCCLRKSFFFFAIVSKILGQFGSVKATDSHMLKSMRICFRVWSV